MTGKNTERAYTTSKNAEQTLVPPLHAPEPLQHAEHQHKVRIK